MASNHIIKFLVNKDQLEMIKNNASVKGYKTVSAYLRDFALSRDLRFETMLIEIHREVVNNGKPNLEIEVPEWIKVVREILRKQKDNELRYRKT